MNKFQAFFDTCEAMAKMSYSKRKQVGCVITKNNRIVSTGWNGTPRGFDNCCEDENGNTKPEVLHAEFNAITTMLRHGISSLDCELWVNLSPCLECAKLIANSGIKTVYYREEYRLRDGLEFLKKCNIMTIKC